MDATKVTILGALLLLIGATECGGARGDLDRLKGANVDAIALKPIAHDFQLDPPPVILRCMNRTDG